MIIVRAKSKSVIVDWSRSIHVRSRGVIATEVMLGRLINKTLLRNQVLHR